MDVKELILDVLQQKGGRLIGLDIVVLLRLRHGVEDKITRRVLIELLRDKVLWIFEGKYQREKPLYPANAIIVYDDSPNMNKDFDQDDEDDGDLDDFDDPFGGWLRGGY